MHDRILISQFYEGSMFLSWLFRVQSSNKNTVNFLTLRIIGGFHLGLKLLRHPQKCTAGAAAAATMCGLKKWILRPSTPLQMCVEHAVSCLLEYRSQDIPFTSSFNPFQALERLVRKAAVGERHM